MRSARTSFGIILTLSLLAVPLSAVGQSADEAPAEGNEATEPVYVTWRGGYSGAIPVPAEAEEFPWGIREYKGNTAYQTSDDPRIRGKVTYISIGDGSYPPNGADEVSRHATLIRIENDEGAWQGPAMDVFLPDWEWLQYGWLEGEGAYEGLSFFTSFRGDSRSGGHEGEGMIWPGDPPPVPDLALLQATLDR